MRRTLSAVLAVVAAAALLGAPTPAAAQSGQSDDYTYCWIYQADQNGHYAPSNVLRLDWEDWGQVSRLENIRFGASAGSYYPPGQPYLRYSIDDNEFHDDEVTTASFQTNLAETHTLNVFGEGYYAPLGSGSHWITVDLKWWNGSIWRQAQIYQCPLHHPA